MSLQTEVLSHFRRRQITTQLLAIDGEHGRSTRHAELLAELVAIERTILAKLEELEAVIGAHE